MTESHAQALKELARISTAPPSSFICPSNEHRLQTPWTFYWLNKGRLNTSTNHETYLSNLRSLGTFNSVESFWRHYSHLKKPSQFASTFNLALFRANLVPAWEVRNENVSHFKFVSDCFSIYSHFQRVDVGLFEYRVQKHFWIVCGKNCWCAWSEKGFKHQRWWEYCLA